MKRVNGAEFIRKIRFLKISKFKIYFSTHLIIKKNKKQKKLIYINNVIQRKLSASISCKHCQ